MGILVDALVTICGRCTRFATSPTGFLVLSVQVSLARVSLESARRALVNIVDILSELETQIVYAEPQ